MAGDEAPNEMPGVEAPNETCFMAMPITTSDDQAERYSDEAHWAHIMEHFFEPAIREAGFEPIRPIAQGSVMIHEEIINHLENADMVLVDLSSANPNVFFELGVRTSLNLPVAIVRDEFLTRIPFDVNGINTHDYPSGLRFWDKDAEHAKLTAFLTASRESCEGENPLWRKFGLTRRAQQPSVDESPLEAKVDLMTATLQQMVGGAPQPRGLRPEDMLVNVTFIPWASATSIKDAVWTGSGGGLLSDYEYDVLGYLERLKTDLASSGLTAEIEVSNHCIDIHVPDGAARPSDDWLQNRVDGLPLGWTVRLGFRS